MSGFSAWTFAGAAGVAYRAGLAATGLYLGNALSFLLGVFVFARRWRRSRITTVMEYLSGRSNLATHQTFSWSTIVFQLFTSASTLYGLSLFVSSACGFSVTWTILSAGAIIIFYCVMGCGGHRFPASVHSHAVLPGLGDHISCPRRWDKRAHSFLPPEMKTMHVSGEFGWVI